MRALVLVISLAWMGASWWWYVCQIKDYCGGTSSVAESASSQVTSETPVAPNTETEKQKTASNNIGDEIQSLVKSAENQVEKKPEEPEQASKKTEENDTSTTKSIDNIQGDKAKSDQNDEAADEESNEAKQEPATQEDAKPDSQEKTADSTSNTEQKVEEDINDALEKAASTSIEPQAIEESADANDPTKIRIDRVKNESGNDSSVQSVRIYFPYNSSTQADLTGSASLYFDQLVQILEADESVELLLTGHTDSQGAANRNKTLGKRRADSVKEILVKKGIPAGRIKTASEGEAKPLQSNASKAGRDKNRRVELIGVKKATE